MALTMKRAVIVLLGIFPTGGDYRKHFTIKKKRTLATAMTVP
jgi:hypothetical protein